MHNQIKYTYVIIKKVVYRCPGNLLPRFYQALNMVLSNIPFCTNTFFLLTQNLTTYFYTSMSYAFITNLRLLTTTMLGQQ